MKSLHGFRSFFYLDTLDYSNRDELVKSIETAYQQNPTHKPDSWEDNVHTSIVYDKCITPSQYFDKAHIPNDLVKLIDDKLQEFITKENLASVGKFYIHEMWYNAYKNGQYQHMHKHSNGNNTVFSGVYYLKFDEKEHSSTRFYHPGFEIDFTKVKDNDFFMFTPKVKENDILFFSSDIGHDVPEQFSSNLRITVAFNVICEFHESIQYS